MDISNKFIAGLATALLLGIALHQYHLCRQKNPVVHSTEIISLPTPASYENVISTPVEIPLEPPAPELPTIVDPYESPAVQERMLDEQVRRMEEYALEAGPDDPFSKTPEQIEEFRKRGNPIVW